MSTSLESFVNVIRRSGLVEESVLVESVEALKQAGRELTGESLAELLVSQGKITSWQSAKLLQGKHKGFFLGKYKLLRLLGKGGMSSVYLAEHVLMRRRCAIKVLPWKLVKDSSYLQRFHREAQAVAALDHPNIVRAYDIDHEKDGNLEIHFLVMEYVEGKNLFDLVQQIGPLPPALAADYIRQGALGLQHAHAVGMVHRDVKPGNFIVDQNGVVKLMDLGLARVAAQEDHSLTIAHDERVLGTADYLAPEQAVDSHLVDTRADIYSLGCTLYFLLTGRPPFNEGTLTQRLLAHQTKEPPSPRSLRPDLPESLLVILQKMMVKDREKRVQNADEVVQLLDQWLSQNSSSRAANTSVATAAIAHPESAEVQREGAGMVLRGNPDSHPPSNPLGDFLSSLSDLDATSQTPPDSSRQISDSATMRLDQSETDDPDQPLEPYLDHFETEQEDDNPFGVARSSSSIKTGARPHSAKSSGKMIAGSGKTGRRKGNLLDSVISALPPKVQEQIAKAPIPIAAGAGLVVLLLVGGILFAFSGSGPKKKVPTPDRPPIAKEQPAGTTPAAPVAEMKRPEIRGTVISVGPNGNFDSLQKAIDYLKENSSTSSVAMGIREIQLEGKQTLKEAVRVDNSGLGGFPRGIKITSPAAEKVRLESNGSAPAIFLDSVEGLVIENLIIDCQGRSEGIVIRGYSYGTQLSNLTLENVQNTGIKGIGASGLPGQPILIRECTLIGTSSSARGISLDSTSGYDCRVVTIQQCRFLGPMSAGIIVEGAIESLEAILNLFFETSTGLQFTGTDAIYKKNRIANNTFFGGATGIRFSDPVSSSSSEQVIEKNLFVKQTEGAASFSGNPESLLKRGAARFNWTDGNPPTGFGEALFSQNGLTAKPVEFVSENPADVGFLKPKTPEIHNGGAPAPNQFFGAISP